MESKPWLTIISKMINSAITGMADPREIPAITVVENSPLPSVEVTTVLLTEFALSAVLFFVEVTTVLLTKFALSALLFFVGVTTVLLTHFVSSAEDVNKTMYL